jgi:hypothetical protein
MLDDGEEENVPTLTYENEIDESHPTVVDTNFAYEADAMAMKLVGERHGKRELVNLVRWLIMDNADIACRDTTILSIRNSINNNMGGEEQ